MNFSGFVVQLLNGLAGASSLFLVAAGLSLIFGVTRIVNFAHGSFYMIGIYVAYSMVGWLGTGLGFWPALLLAAVAVGVLGAVVEMVLLRRIYRAPELFQLLATFALVLVLRDGVLWLWGAEELLGPRAPGLSGAVTILGRLFPTYDLFLIVVGPAVLGLLWLLLSSGAMGPYGGRVLSFLVAATVTWALHRSFTFPHARRERRGRLVFSACRSAGRDRASILLRALTPAHNDESE